MTNAVKSNGSNIVRWAGFIFGIIVAFTTLVIYIADIRSDVAHNNERCILYRETHDKQHINLNALLTRIEARQIKIMVKLGVDPE